MRDYLLLAPLVNFVVLVVFIVCLILVLSRWYHTLYALVDGRMTELLALNKEAAVLVGRAAERADQILREQHAKDQSDLERQQATTAQTERILSTQQPPETGGNR